MKILVVNTQSVNHQNATGITLRSIFKNFNPSDCLEFYMQPCVKASDALDIKSERISPFVCFFRHLANKFMHAGGASATKTNNNSKQTLKAKLRSRLIMCLDFEPVFLVRKMINQIKDFAPDCIYTLGNSIDTMKLAVKLSKKFNVPIVPHFMDNWQASHRYGPCLYPYHLKRTQVWLKRIYDRTEKALTISPKMANEYENRWGKPHYAIMNTVDVEYYHNGCITTTRSDSDRDFVLTYAGGLHLNRYKSVMELGKAIDKYNEMASRKIRLRLYTDEKSRLQYGELLSSTMSVDIRNYVPHDQILEVYSDCDALLHIETFDENYQEFIRYSLSTKISEFLSCGKPILLYSPEDIFVFQYLKEHNAGIVVGASDKLDEAIYRLANSQDNSIICENAYLLAKQYHDDSYLRKTLLEVFENDVKSKNSNVSI